MSQALPLFDWRSLFGYDPSPPDRESIVAEQKVPAGHFHATMLVRVVPSIGQ